MRVSQLREREVSRSERARAGVSVRCRGARRDVVRRPRASVMWDARCYCGVRDNFTRDKN